VTLDDLLSKEYVKETHRTRSPVQTWVIPEKNRDTVQVGSQGPQANPSILVEALRKKLSFCISKADQPSVLRLRPPVGEFSTKDKELIGNSVAKGAICPIEKDTPGFYSRVFVYQNPTERCDPFST